MTSISQQKDVCAIIVAAGAGSRAGTKPKQFRVLAGKPMLQWSVEAFAAHERVGSVIVVSPPHQKEATLTASSSFPIIVIPGGETRSQSVLRGLAAAKDFTPQYVFIHDAARPGVTTSDIDTLLQALLNVDGAAPALPVADSLKRTDASGLILDRVDRTGLHRAQTPQAFRYNRIMQAYDALPAGYEATDDLAIAQTAGCALSLVPGHQRLDKITFAEDFDRMERLLSPQAAYRTGSGFDVHAFGPGDYVTLCGVKISYGAGLVGHSDADAPWHALTDAILGALADGDIGDHFPPSDEQWRGMDSAHFLKFAGDRVQARGGVIVNADITVICEAPKIKPHREAMRTRTAEVLNIDLGAVSVKATTTEQLGFLGRKEGLAAQAVVTIRL